MTITTHTLSAATVMLSGVAGGKLASITAESLQMPEWLQILTGPLGALGAALFALRWLVARLDKSESKFEAAGKQCAKITAVRQWLDTITAPFVLNPAPRNDWPDAPHSFEETVQEAVAVLASV
jgi:hypothetical protein